MRGERDRGRAPGPGARPRAAGRRRGWPSQASGRRRRKARRLSRAGRTALPASAGRKRTRLRPAGRGRRGCALCRLRPAMGAPAFRRPGLGIGRRAPPVGCEAGRPGGTRRLDARRFGDEPRRGARGPGQARFSCTARSCHARTGEPAPPRRRRPARPESATRPDSLRRRSPPQAPSAGEAAGRFRTRRRRPRGARPRGRSWSPRTPRSAAIDRASGEPTAPDS